MARAGDDEAQDTLRERVDKLEAGALTDSATIEQLRGQAREDEDTIAGLRSAAVENHATIDRLRVEAAGQTSEIANLHRAVDSRDVIGQAKGIIMNALGCGADQAFAHLRAQSQRTNRKLIDVATEIAATGHLPPTDDDRQL